MGNEVGSGGDAEEVERWIQQLIGGGGARAHAAAELGRLGVWTRGSVRTRGSIARSAVNRLPTPARIEAVISALGDADRATRCQVAQALGEWGGTEAAAALASLLRLEEDPDVRMYAVHALRTIGGPNAVEALRGIAETGDEAESGMALDGIEELLTGGSLQDTEPAAAPADTGSIRRGADVPLRGAVKTRRATRSVGSSSVEDLLAATLRQVQASRRASMYSRIRATEVLQSLKR